MAKHRIAPELRERAIMHMMPPYNWSLRTGFIAVILPHHLPHKS